MKLKIGELAKITEVTKRTIDYYTNLGLLKAQRSAANYRYYDENAISQIKYIEECKRNRLSLEQIKERLHNNKMDNVDMNHLKEKLENLDKEIKGILQSFEGDNQHKKGEMRNTISHESISLIQTLLLLLS
ncbi:MerR family transcriptional regulator [Niallia sp. NCCP-28]|uniref:MerR family transcriptional regulator n=1 Tax=Niallia sp. NCCP-28 TaxID=2934712 RepID=UPI00207F8CEB|nr:MerR family transcriptional regulator [Niallia sp. NCCP-28]GKU84531.1 HTH-type transcriptional regulator CueR [Niallia sp. NCCP-28]